MIPILMYHQVAEIPLAQDPRGLAVSPSRFEQQMNYLYENGFHCITLYDVVRNNRDGWKLPSRPIVITFDDGYQNVLTNASPILNKYGFTATIFLVANQLGTESNWWGQDGAFSGQLLKREEILEMIHAGFTMGSHSMNHRFLDELDEKLALDEIKQSKEFLEGQLDTSIDFFSYPFSRKNAKTEKLVEQSGYLAACAGYSGRWGIFNLWRVPIHKNDSLFIFGLKVRGFYNLRTFLRESKPGLILRDTIRSIRKKL